MKTFVAQTPDQWRRWLVEHHDSESEVREETKARRLQEAIRLLAAGKPLGLK